MADFGWDTKKVATDNSLPAELPAVASVDPTYDGEMYRVENRKFRFVYSHWAEVKTRKPRTPKEASSTKS